MSRDIFLFVIMAWHDERDQKVNASFGNSNVYFRFVCFFVVIKTKT